jgi:hypothetical protein
MPRPHTPHTHTTALTAHGTTAHTCAVWRRRGRRT